MEITLEQSLAAAVRYIQDNSETNTKLYFDEIPEDFYVPSIYFQVPTTSGRKATLRSYCTTITMNVWFMASDDWSAYANAAEMRDKIMLDNCEMPVYAADGKNTERYIRVNEPDTRRIDEGINQLSFSIDVYFHPEYQKTKIQTLHTAWNKSRNVTNS